MQCREFRDSKDSHNVEYKVATVSVRIVISGIEYKLVNKDLQIGDNDNNY